ncbi:hypothetical protein N7520_004855 [Penicillium odoratum]|uniref:uncharacterized protein n=1 Tax=Penicillium odoratum TaxID=1167516 RepID=UPI0025466556|nr:uncharacterized protein N7520_004855 [Penicillium odoratum]KAJ5765296.1 hypothetical protein N7520_004855 [Penicillium odoratum]
MWPRANRGLSLTLDQFTLSLEVFRWIQLPVSYNTDTPIDFLPSLYTLKLQTFTWQLPPPTSWYVLSQTTRDPSSRTQNSLFNSALKQSSAIRRDLDTFAQSPATSSAALQGQIAASLASISRTIDDYSALSKKELIPEKQQKAFDRVKNFRNELADYRTQFDRLRKEREDAQSATNRSELLGRRPHHAATPENPYAQSNLPQASSSFAPSSGLSFGGGPADHTRESHALREQSFFSNTNTQLDDFLDRGRAVLADLGQQREVLKGTQRRLYSVANTLGMSGDTIRMVERRARQDKWIFWGGVIIFILFCWLVLHFLR